jgi:TonB-linked SusC/RagA family outer membrane protein
VLQEVSSSENLAKGTVVDENGQPIVGVFVQELGTTKGTVTDADGNFSLEVGSNAKLQFSFLGYKTVVTKPEGNMRIVMKEDNAQLDEVVVVGYGAQKKANLTGAVSTVDLDKTLTSRPEQDVTKALQGAVPGLTVLNTSGDINSEPTLRIRGLGTLSNSQTSSPFIVVDGVPVDDLSMINANDIASISVLKDAAASSIYGTRAAFGVILITTKNAKKGDRIKIDYTNNFAWDGSTYLPGFPNVPTQLEAAIRAKKRAGSDAVELFGMYFDQLLPYANEWIKENGDTKIGYGEMRAYQSDTNVGDYRFNGKQPMYYANYDIAGIWYQDAAPSQSHNISLSGASGRTTFYTSVGYNKKEDQMSFNPAEHERMNATLNLQTDITDWLQIGARLNFTRSHFSRANAYNNIYQYLWRWGSFFIPSGSIDGEDFRVIAMQKQASRFVDTTDRLRMNAYVKANITKDLTFNADYTYDIENENYKQSNHSVYGMNWSAVTPGYIVQPSTTNARRDNFKSNRWTANAYLNYAHTFADVHNLNVMLGMNGENYSSDYFYARRTQLYSEEYPELNLAYGDLKNATIDSSTGDRASAGYFGRINYDYKGIYLLELNGRYDGSSRFPSGDRWAFFPSFSAGYRISEEPYWQKLGIKDIVDNVKLRFSYGSIGNEAVGDWMFLSTISTISQSYVHWLSSAGAKVAELDLPDWTLPSLSWERINTTNLGLDLGFLNDQITASFELYQRDTKDMLAPGKALPSSVGASAPYTNAGQLRTNGWEFTLNLRHQFTKDFGAYFNFSIGDSKTKVHKWNNESKLIGHPGSVSYAYEGETWGDIWGFETDRYFTEDDFDGPIISNNQLTGWNYKKGVADQTGLQTENFIYGPGDIKYKDLNGDGVIDGGKGTLEDHGDLKVIGNTMPRYEYSFHIGGNYKGLDLDLFFQGVGKRDEWTQSSFVFPEMREADLAIYDNQTSYNIYDYTIANNTLTVTQNTINQGNDFPTLYPGNEYAGNVVGLASEGGCHNYYPQTKYLVNMSYLRLKNITLGYTLPKALTMKAYIQKLRIYGSVNNLCLIHKGSGNLPIDPEMDEGQGSLGYGTWGRTYPITRSWSIGLQVTF